MSAADFKWETYLKMCEAKAAPEHLFKPVSWITWHVSNYYHGQKSWNTFAFLGRFPIHTGPTPPLTPHTMLDACIQNFFEFQICIGWGEGELQENFEKDAVFLRGIREMTEKYEYCSSVARTFVQDCSCAYLVRLCLVPPKIICNCYGI